MASIVIVADQCYLLAEAINYIVINEVDDSDDREWRPRLRKDRKSYSSRPEKIAREYNMERKPYHIIINFVAKGQPPSSVTGNSMRKSGEETSTINIKIHGYKRTLSLFQNIVDQLREQIPDEFFLNKLVEQFLAGEED